MPYRFLLPALLLLCASCGVADSNVVGEEVCTTADAGCETVDPNQRIVDYMPLDARTEWTYAYSSWQDIFNSPEETEGVLSWRLPRTAKTTERKVYTLIESFDGHTRRGYFDGNANWEFVWEPLRPLQWERVLTIEEEDGMLRFTYADSVSIAPDSVWNNADRSAYAMGQFLQLWYIPQPVSRFVVNGRDSLGASYVDKGLNAWYFVRDKGLVQYEWVRAGVRTSHSQRLILRE